MLVSLRWATRLVKEHADGLERADRHPRLIDEGDVLRGGRFRHPHPQVGLCPIVEGHDIAALPARAMDTTHCQHLSVVGMPAVVDLNAQNVSITSWVRRGSGKRISP